MTAVENVLSTSFCAVPAFIRVDPVTTSGPVSTPMNTSTDRAASASGLAQSSTVEAPLAPGRGERPEDVRGASAGRQTDHQVTGAYTTGRLGRAAPVVVLGVLDGPPHGVRAAREVGAEPVPGRVEGGRQLGRVEHAQPAGGAGAEVVHPVTAAQGRDRQVDGGGDLVEHRGDRGRAPAGPPR